MSEGIKEFLLAALIEQITRLSDHCSELETIDLGAETLLSQLIEIALSQE